MAKDSRGKGYGRKMLQDVCHKYDAKYMTGFIDLTSDNYKETLIKHLTGGYEIIDANKDGIIVAITREKLFNE